MYLADHGFASYLQLELGCGLGLLFFLVVGFILFIAIIGITFQNPI
jgi:hypothetical protein